MADLLRLLQPFLSPPLLRHVRAHPGAGPQRAAQRFPAAVLFADVSGFTPLTEALGRQGSAGAEELHRLMNHYFHRMIALAADEGGEVVGFSGDAVSVLFPALDEPLEYMVRRAYQAGETMQAAMPEFAALETSVGTVELGMKICIGAGEVVALQVGGVFERWEYLIAGDPLRQIAAAEPLMKRGALLLSPEAQALLYPAPLPARRRSTPVSTGLAPADLATLRCFVSRAVEHALRTGRHDWLSELRPMSVLFIGAAGIDYSSETGSEALHQLVRTVQAAIYRYEGSLVQVTVDDKGTIIIALFGAPPLAHEDDARRAVQSALDLQAHYRERTEHADTPRLKLGIATGRVFVGLVGGEIRRTYTAMGDTVNLAARLMGKAAVGDLLCDAATYRQAGEQLRFAALPAVQLKGKSSPLPVYRPLGAWPAGTATEPADLPEAAAEAPLVGRQQELAQLEMLLDKLAAGQGRVLLVQGEAGIGKSRLVRELLRRADQRGRQSLTGAGQSIEQQTPYRAWRDVFSRFFALEAGTTTEQQRKQVQKIVAELAPEQQERLPLLNDLLNLELPETALSAGLDAALRRQNLGLLLLNLLQAQAGRSPLILVLEDAHWLDSLSWDFLLQLARSLPLTETPIGLLISMRPPEAGSPAVAAVANLRELPHTTEIGLGQLDVAATIQLVTARLGLAAGSLPDEVAQLVERYAGGNPFFAEELVLTLRDLGRISIEADPAAPKLQRCLVTGDIRQMQEHLPTTIQGLILARLDRLSADARLIVKVAAVIGQIFEHLLLNHALQQHATMAEPALALHLHSLHNLEITRIYAQEPDLAYMFHHIIIQEVAYQTLLFAQRRRLHRTIGAWYETAFSGVGFSIEQLNLAEPGPRPTVLGRYYALLAYHYRYAEEAARERQYAWLAGEQAAARYANSEALQYLTRALELTGAEDLSARYALLLTREQIYDRQGDRTPQQADLAALAELAGQMGDPARQTEIAIRQANYWIVTGNYPAAIAAVRRTAAQRDREPAPELLARARLQWGRALRFQGDYAEAEQQLRQALELARSASMAELEAEVLRQLGGVAFFQDDYATARSYDEQALQIFRRLQNRQQEAYALDVLGSDASEQGDYAAAMDYYEQALALFQTVGDQWGMALTLGNLGQVCREQGYYSRALSAGRQGLELARMTGDTRTEGWLLGNLGWALLDCGEYAEARHMFEQALLACRRIDARMEEGWVLSGLGLLCHLQGDQAAAEAYEHQVLALAQTSGERSLEADARLCLGHALAAAGRLAEAAQSYHESLELWQEVGQRNRAMEAYAGLARMALAQGDQPAALARVEMILAYLAAHTLAGTDQPFRVYLTCYEVLRATGDPRARPIREQARRQLRERAGQIVDADLRQSYLERVPAHRALLANQEPGSHASA